MSAFTNEPIAIIGSGCRFPGASNNPSKLWNLLQERRDVSSKIDRFAAESFYHENGHHHGTSNILRSYLLEEDTKAFDAQFFNIAGSEAGTIDPQQRFLMEVIYEGLESAGKQIETLSGSSTGVYVGVMCNDFSQLTYADIENVPKYAATGTALSILSNRISYFFNWTGPSMTIDTACSSSLIAVHQAVQLLRSGQSKMAVAAGTNLIFTPMNYIAESNLNMLSPTGRSQMWDANADGYARGEGVGCVVLKLLKDAIADGDPIESVIRETGTNQDGRTPGITMPSSTAQEALIQETYRRAGLDPLKESDRCQYFEAHGTGTKAGDPQEARAIYSAFHPGDESERSHDNILHVGSIKTIIGHTEGTAGIAGLLKASLAVQHGIIPANMHFNELNPDIEPYYGFLRIPTAEKAWPELPAGQPRRASVNSFGFGGANAHAIVENYVPAPGTVSTAPRSTNTSMPFVFSSKSETGLASQIKSFLQFLEEADETVNARDVAWTLSRRSWLSNRAAFAADDLPDLAKKLNSALAAKKDDGKEIGTLFSPVAQKGEQKILGVFTGQGAQWPSMGHKLIEASPVARATMQRLEESLQTLPAQDRPSWSIIEELSKSKDESRVMQSEFSQPLCTAVQVMLVDVLRATGITFDAVVGHSSGEIGAAYASGFLSAADAIRVAYFRGSLGHLANANGAMLAAGTDMADAQELCNLPVFRGRINVAASNSSSSMTISGDGDAVDRATLILEDESKFARKLKVDKAYHSHHMKPCASPYMEAMGRSKVNVLKPSTTTKWFSSVLDGELMTSEMADKVAGSYWTDNLLNPVLFSQAITAAVADIGKPTITIEVGPHPALKGPASGTISDATGGEAPYTGVLARNSNDKTALLQGIGAIWAQLGTSETVNFGNLDAAFVGGQDKPVHLKQLPTYAWDHERAHWNISRATKAIFDRPLGHHELLGSRIPGTENEYRWRNFISPKEMPWLSGHQIQGTMIFPGAGYASMAMEACKALAPIQHISLIELTDLKVTKAMSLTDAGVECMVALTNVRRESEQIFCEYECYVCLNADSTPAMAAYGGVRVELGTVSLDTLPPRNASALNMGPVDMDLFYGTLHNIGYHYDDMFKSITDLNRTTDHASGIIHVEGAEDYDPDFVFHPAPLDVAFQSVFGAYGAPGDGRLWNMQVPTLINRIRVNPHACQSAGLHSDMPFDTVIAPTSEDATDALACDVDICDEAGNTLVQVEGLELSPLAAATEADDRHMFSTTEWCTVDPDATKGFTKWNLTEEVYGHAVFTERVCFFYMKRLHDAVTPEQREKADWHQGKYLAWVAEVVAEVEAGAHRIIPKEWLNDNFDQMQAKIDDMIRLYPDFRFLTVVGENLIAWVKGEISFLEIYREDNILEPIYKNSYGFPEYNAYMGKLVHQLSRKHRQMNILEIGAGTGSATEAIMSRIGEDNYASYTYTDISAGFFLEAEEIFKKHGDKFIFSTLDVEKDIGEQGYTEGSYDLVVASNVLHATKSLETTLKNARKLLRPGGYLAMLEITDVDPVRPTFFFGTIAGWWVGENDGRPHHPLQTQSGWNDVLKRSGFAGIDTATPPSGEFTVPQSIMLAQAVDTQMNLIRQPLAPESEVELDDLLILGSGNSTTSFQLQDDVLSKLKPVAKEITYVDRLENLQESHFTQKQLIISFLELDEHVFNPFTPAKWAGFQLLTEKAQKVVWITYGGGNGTVPYSNMILAVARCLTGEKPELLFQNIDFDSEAALDATIVAEAVLRMQISDAWNAFIQPYNTTWALEREIRVIDGVLHIPRYINNHTLNGRYNASRRTIRESADLSDNNVALSAGKEYALREVVEQPWAASFREGRTEIRVERSSLTALNMGSSALYLLVGETTSGKKVLAFSESNASKVYVPKSWTAAYNGGEDLTAALVAAVDATSAQIVTSLALATADPKSSILVHEPPTAAFVTALKESVAEHGNGSSVRFITSIKDNATEEVVYAHPSTRTRTIAALFPKNATLAAFVDLSADRKGDSSSLAANIAKQLPRKCRHLKVADIVSTQSFTDASDDQTIPRILERSAKYVSLSEEATEEWPIAEMSGKARQELDLKTKVLNWTVNSSAPVTWSTPEDTMKFRSDKTYWLVGLAGDLGLAQAYWMIQRGARYVAVSSRNPKLSEAWLEYAQASGAVVKAIPCDTTDRRSVLSAHQTIVKTMPPIVGVCQGAMILNDGIIAQMSHESFNQTLRPKVDGTRFLDDIFNKPDLDFFIVYSSLAYVTGNIGQSPYAAANAYMASVAQGRRNRGLAGSVLNLAGIFGIGYITRTDRGIIQRLGKMGYSNVSAWDFLQFFAESVTASPFDAGIDHEISSSLKAYDPTSASNETPPNWINIPRFNYYKRVANHSSKDEDGKKESVRSQLETQTTKEGVYKVLLAGLTGNLYKNLGMRPEDNSIAPHTRLVDLGIDSLVAVDMRLWFTKELDLDMPILKLLGGASVEEMVQDTMERLNPDLTPGLSGATPAAGDAPAPAAEPEKAQAEIKTETPVETKDQEPVSGDTSETASTADDSGHGTSSEDNMSVTAATTPATNRSRAGSKTRKVRLNVPDEPLTFERKMPMSYPSMQFWFLIQQLGPEAASHVFNCSFRIALKGKMDLDRLHKAVQAIGERHDALRTAFFDDVENDYLPTQGVLAPSESPLRLEVQKVNGLQDAIAFDEELNHYAFDIKRGKTIRLALLSESLDMHYLVLGFHHITMDGFSFDVFLNELAALYEGKQLPPVQINWNDLMSQQRLNVKNGTFKTQIEFWRNTLGAIPDAIPMLPMARSQARVPVTKFNFEEPPVLVLDSKTVRGIRERCRELKITRYHFFMAVLRVMLFELTDADELCIGTVDANRTDPRSSSTIGLMVNVLPIKFTRSEGKTSLLDLAQEGRDKAYSALANSNLPFKALLDHLAVPRSTTFAPLFQVVLDYLPSRVEPPTGLGTPVDEVKASLNYSMADIVLDVNDISATEIRLRWRAQTSLYSSEATQMMLDIYANLVKKFATADSKLPIDSTKLGLYNAEDVQSATNASLGPSMTSQWPETVSHVIDIYMSSQPDATALKDGLGNNLTYSQLSKRVDDIASTLLEGGKQTRVAGYQEPTIDWICSLLAVWKVGATYVPLDSRLPVERISVMVAGSKPSSILVHPATLESAKGLKTDARVIDVSSVNSAKAAVPSTKATAESPALIIFTSGSTGTPKGVEVPHSSLKNVIEGLAFTYGFGKDTQVSLQHSAHSFDICFGQVLHGLCNGGSVFVVSKDDRADPQALAKIIRDEKITIVMSTPGEYSQWLRFGRTELLAADSWKFGFSGGEAMKPSLKRAFKDLGKDVKLINAYGPAETIILTTTTVIDYQNVDEEHEDNNVVSMGKPIPNSGVFVVDHNSKPVPVGVTGEIVITGAGVANGYFGRDDLTKAAFVSDTLTPRGHPTRSAAGAAPKMYRTGDNGRYAEDGNLYFEGRISGDSQVKLNGVRIETKEVESVIVQTSNGAVREAVVTVRRNPDFLIAHVEFAHQSLKSSTEQRKYLSSLLARLPLPKYMTPAFILPLDSIPLTAHGKIDTKAVEALPLPTGGDGESDESLTETQSALKEIWIETLPEEVVKIGASIGPNTSFFSLGGGSYLLVFVQGLIRSRFQVSIPVMELFDATTLRDMAQKIDNTIAIAPIDWDQETSLELDLEVASEVKKSGDNVTVVLTGATGYLGRNLLNKLVAHDRVSKVVCVAFRGDEPETFIGEYQDFLKKTKIEVLKGDLGAPMLGLDEATFENLGKEADVIVHSGANRSFWDYYQTLSGPNVSSTRTLAKLAGISKIPLHFISSGGLVPADEANESEPGCVTKNGVVPPVDGSNGYLATKWASEAYLEQARKELGLPTFIHRVTGVSSTAEKDSESPLPEQLVTEFLDLAVQLQAVPQQQGWQGSFDMVRTSTLSENMVNTFLASTEQTPYIHYPATVNLEMKDVVEGLEAYKQARDDMEREGFETLPPHVWVGKAKKIGLDWHFAGQDFTSFGAQGVSLRR